MTPTHYVEDYEEVTGKKREDFEDEVKDGVLKMAQTKVITSESDSVEVKDGVPEEVTPEEEA